MSKSHIPAPKFQLAFLLPKYWLTWFGVLVLYTISWLPYAFQVQLAKGVGSLLKAIAKKRVKIAERNFALCFPELTEAERADLLEKHVHSTGMAVFEASMGWWWPTWRVRKHARIEGFEHIEAIRAKGKGVLALAIHNMNLEFGCRVVGLRQPSIAFYRKHDNAVMEYMQYHGRARSNKYMISKRNVRGLIDALNDGELCLYLPDQDYGRNRSEFVPFFNVAETATTKGTLLFAKEANCEAVFIMSQKTNDGYVIRILPGLENFPSGDDKGDVARINQRVEEMVRMAPEQYLWMHKRFKTRPDPNAPSLYS